MALEHRLKQIEIRLKWQPRVPHNEAQGKDLLYIPKETEIEAYGIIKEAGGYQLMFRPEEIAMMSKDEIIELNQLTPVEFYEMIHSPVQMGQ